MALQWPSGCACLAALKSRQAFGMFLLLLVDFIWVGSAGLTKYLLKVEYDKPLFTVYFKTSLFSIYLLPFLFWRPWQRLCCVGVRETRGQEGVGRCPQTVQEQVQKGEEKDEQDTKPSAEDDCNIQDWSIAASLSSFNNSTLSEPTLGPSEFAPLNCDTELDEKPQKPVPAATETASTPIPLLSSSGTCSCPMRQCRVRFCQTVEVKHVPLSCQSVELAPPTPPPALLQPVQLLPVKTVVKLAVIFGLLWFFANYLYALALQEQSVAAVNILSSLSGVVVLVLAAIPLPSVSRKDKFTLTKFIIITISVAGAVLMGVSPSSDHTNGVDFGAVFAVGGAILYGCYLVLLSKAVPHPDSLEIPMFFGFVGVFDMILLVPLIALWQYVGWEEFQLPTSNYTWTLLLINGLVGTVLSELFWLWGCLLTSSLVGTLSLSLVTPLSILYSILISKAKFSILFFFGAILVVLAFAIIAFLDHTEGWDPMLLICKHMVKLAKDHMSHEHYDNLTAESQALLSKRNSTGHCPMSF